MLGTLSNISQPSFRFAVRSPRRGTSVSAAVSEVAAPDSTAADRRCHYEVLRVKRSASQVEIKTAYRTLAKLYHPDATARFMESSVAAPPSDGRDFIEIRNAYATLSDPDARAVYDFSLSVGAHRRWNVDGISGFRSGRFRPTRRWETDQCW